MASLVEFVEALTVVLAVGVVRGWRSALAGATAALLVLLTMIAVFGPSLARIPLGLLQFLIGTLLLLFGLRWLRKAILRSAGRLALHDEMASFAQQTASLESIGMPVSGWDRIAVATAFKIVMLEGIEVVFIVIALGAGAGRLLPAVLGAGAALATVIALGIALHRPLGRIPENTLKFGVGIVLTAFGTFWVAEGMHLAWPYADWSLLALIGAYLGVAWALVVLRRSQAIREARYHQRKPSRQGPIGGVLKEVIGLFVDDGAMALGIVIWVALTGVFSRLPLPALGLDSVFFVGLAALLAYGVLRAPG
ncbi:MAG TPA: hypothetical protein VGV09_02935 [Steroidobacteraceae bacterium]|nr:hypothetical protein [Steroidobacteraceae bacterium]